MCARLWAKEGSCVQGTPVLTAASQGASRPSSRLKGGARWGRAELRPPSDRDWPSVLYRRGKPGRSWGMGRKCQG